MPPENLPDAAKKIFVAAEATAKSTTCKDRSDKDECASKIAWSAVKRKFKKDADGNWIPKAEVSNFSMAITRTSYDKSTDTRRWKAVASDTDNDLYNDSMTLELFNDFMQRIETKEQPPKSFRSDFWSGGIPYLSISHYPDLSGKGVPGPVDAIYIDGRTDAGRGMLKASGRFDDTPIGKECFKAISRDIEDKVPDDQKIRISIAFLDWMHRHKSSGFVFDRTESDEIICPECLEELITGKAEGKEFLKGHLVHLALTRVPVNTRTSMEVERSMTTRKEDAESIVGNEIAEELEEEATLEGKSLATDGDPMVVIKAEDEPEVEEKREKPSDYKEDDDEEEDDKKKKKEMKEDKSEADKIDSVLHLLEELKADLAVEPDPVHPLDPAISELKSVYDEAVKMENTEEALMAVNEPYEALVSVIQNNLSKEEIAEISEENAEISQLRSFMVEQFGLIQSQISAIKSQPQQVLPEGTPPPEVPMRRSVTMSPELFAKPKETQSETPKLTATVRRSVGLE
jgi:cation transport regulator ChaB